MREDLSDPFTGLFIRKVSSSSSSSNDLEQFSLSWTLAKGNADGGKQGNKLLPPGLLRSKSDVSLRLGLSLGQRTHVDLSSAHWTRAAATLDQLDDAQLVELMPALKFPRGHHDVLANCTVLTVCHALHAPGRIYQRRVWVGREEVHGHGEVFVEVDKEPPEQAELLDVLNHLQEADVATSDDDEVREDAEVHATQYYQQEAMSDLHEVCYHLKHKVGVDAFDPPILGIFWVRYEYFF